MEILQFIDSWKIISPLSSMQHKRELYDSILYYHSHDLMSKYIIVEYFVLSFSWFNPLDQYTQPPVVTPLHIHDDHKLLFSCGGIVLNFHPKIIPSRVDQIKRLINQYKYGHVASFRHCLVDGFHKTSVLL